VLSKVLAGGTADGRMDLMQHDAPSRSATIAILVMILVAIVTLAESAYLGINGAHAFRQADAYSHILGALHARGLSPFQLFIAREPWGSHAVFDLPLYEYGAALVSGLLKKDPLVAARYVNILLWLISAYAGYRLALQTGKNFSGLFFLVLFSASPLFLHYFAAPLPDNLAIALSAAGTILLLRDKMRKRDIITSILLLAAASAVKSPIPFIFLTFTACHLLLSWNRREKTLSQMVSSKRGVLIVFVASLILVAAIEIVRQKLGEAHGARTGHIWTWYFGSLEMRLGRPFWTMMASRFNEWLPPVFLWIFIMLSGASLIARRGMAQIACALIPLLAGWLVFSNTYFLHDYYQLPVAYIVFVCTGAMAGHLLEPLAQRQWPLMAAVPSVLAALFLLQVRAEKSLSVKSRTDFVRASEYAALKSDRVLVVTAEGITDDLTAIGGLLSTKLETVSPQDFETGCKRYLYNYSAVLLRNVNSNCIQAHKNTALYYAEESPFVFFRHEPQGSSISP
jgi:hypothetical protein